jgi:UDP-N-acetylglucosamine 4,6-dehydratase
MLKEKSILITGGTGSFGHTFIPLTLERFNPKRLIIYSRDEMKQWEMAKKFQGDSRVRFFIGDVRDKERLYPRADGVDYVVHAAATKIVPTAEYNPFECVKTNMQRRDEPDRRLHRPEGQAGGGAVDRQGQQPGQPVRRHQAGVRQAVRRRQFLRRRRRHPLRRGALRQRDGLARLGHPVLPVPRDKGVLPITDARMTRFMITLEQGVELVWHAFEDMEGGEIYVKKIPSMKVTDMAKRGRPGGRDTNSSASARREAARADDQPEEDSFYTYEYPSTTRSCRRSTTGRRPERIKDGVKVKRRLQLRQRQQPEWMSVETLQGLDRGQPRQDRGASDHDPLRPAGDHRGRHRCGRAMSSKSDFLTQGPAVPASSGRWRTTAERAAVAANAHRGLHMSPAWRWAWGRATGCGPARSPSSPRPTAALYCGARVDFVDIDPRTYNMCRPGTGAPSWRRPSAEGNLPKVVMPVHLPARAATWRPSTRWPSVTASHHRGRLARHRRRYLGAPVGNCRYSDITVFSFHPVKIITTAEGGMALTNDAALAARMALLRSHGITRDPARMTHAPMAPGTTSRSNWASTTA